MSVYKPVFGYKFLSKSGPLLKTNCSFAVQLKKMKKIYHLSSCSTCQRILKEIQPAEDVILQDIKSEPITASQIEAMKNLAGSYASLFSRRAMKYKSLGLAEKDLKEEDYKKYILQEYTFLKRPVMIDGDKIYVGNSKKVVEEAKAQFNS